MISYSYKTNSADTLFTGRFIDTRQNKVRRTLLNFCFVLRDWVSIHSRTGPIEYVVLQKLWQLVCTAMIIVLYSELRWYRISSTTVAPVKSTQDLSFAKLWTSVHCMTDLF